MQRINEEYGSIFEGLITSTKTNSKKTIMYGYDLTPISLIHVCFLIRVSFRVITNVIFLIV